MPRSHLLRTCSSSSVTRMRSSSLSSVKHSASSACSSSGCRRMGWHVPQANPPASRRLHDRARNPPNTPQTSPLLLIQPSVPLPCVLLGPGGSSPLLTLEEVLACLLLSGCLLLIHLRSKRLLHVPEVKMLQEARTPPLARQLALAALSGCQALAWLKVPRTSCSCNRLFVCARRAARGALKIMLAVATTHTLESLPPVLCAVLAWSVAAPELFVCGLH